VAEIVERQRAQADAQALVVGTLHAVLCFYFYLFVWEGDSATGTTFIDATWAAKCVATLKCFSHEERLCAVADWVCPQDKNNAFAVGKITGLLNAVRRKTLNKDLLSDNFTLKPYSSSNSSTSAKRRRLR
jgi:hypothetical protein